MRNTELPNAHQMLLLSAENRKEIMLKAEREKQKKKIESLAKVSKEIDVLVPIITEEIEDAANEGYVSTTVAYTRDSYESDTFYRVADIFRECGYKVFIRYDTVDFGDSAAPCVRDRILLDILWK